MDSFRCSGYRCTTLIVGWRGATHARCALIRTAPHLSARLYWNWKAGCAAGWFSNVQVIDRRVRTPAFCTASSTTLTTSFRSPLSVAALNCTLSAAQACTVRQIGGSMRDLGAAHVLAGATSAATSLPRAGAEQVRERTGVQLFCRGGQCAGNPQLQKFSSPQHLRLLTKNLRPVTVRSS